MRRAHREIQEERLARFGFRAFLIDVGHDLPCQFRQDIDRFHVFNNGVITDNAAHGHGAMKAVETVKPTSNRTIRNMRAHRKTGRLGHVCLFLLWNFLKVLRNLVVIVQVPLADDCRAVSLVAEQLAKCHTISRYEWIIIALDDPALQTRAPVVAARE